MSLNDLPIQIQVRRDDSTDWYSENPVLVSGEPAYDSDKKALKIGDGVKAWRDLPFQTVDYMGILPLGVNQQVEVGEIWEGNGGKPFIALCSFVENFAPQAGEFWAEYAFVTQRQLQQQALEISILQLPEFTVESAGAQAIPVPEGTTGVIDLNVYEPTFGVRPIYQSEYRYDDGLLIIDASANLRPGDKIIASYTTTPLPDGTEIDPNVVHTTGDEDVNGVKTFQDGIVTTNIHSTILGYKFPDGSVQITAATTPTADNYIQDNLTSPTDVKAPSVNVVVLGLSLKEDKAKRGVANGYAPLDASSLIPATHLPAASTSTFGAVKIGPLGIRYINGFITTTAIDYFTEQYASSGAFTLNQQNIVFDGVESNSLALRDYDDDNFVNNFGRTLGFRALVDSYINTVMTPIGSTLTGDGTFRVDLKAGEWIVVKYSNASYEIVQDGRIRSYGTLASAIVQNSLTPASNTKSPTVDAVVGGLALKAPIDNPVFTGYVGIGTGVTPPRSPLDIKTAGILQLPVKTGAFVVTGVDTYGQSLTLQSPVSTYSGALMTAYKASGASGAAMSAGVKFANDTPDYFQILNNNGVNLFTVKNNDGKIGLGTTSPAQRLDVAGTIVTNSATLPSLYGGGSIVAFNPNGTASQGTGIVTVINDNSLGGFVVGYKSANQQKFSRN